MGTYSYRLSAMSDVGLVKEVNQDSYLLKMGIYNGEPFILALVADGMGGVNEGEMASRSIRTAFLNWYEEELSELFEADNIEEALIDAWDRIIRCTHEELNLYGSSKGYGYGKCPGTTLALLFLYGGTHYIANIGDSRVYKLSDRLKQLTKDHSWAQQALDRGVSEEEIEFDARKNMITRCLGCGIEDDVSADYFTGLCMDGDYYLLCTDGLRHYISTSEITEALLQEDKNTKEKCSYLIELAKEREETDNISVIIIQVSSDAAAASEKEDKDDYDVADVKLSKDIHEEEGRQVSIQEYIHENKESGKTGEILEAEDLDAENETLKNIPGKTEELHLSPEDFAAMYPDDMNK